MHYFTYDEMHGFVPHLDEKTRDNFINETIAEAIANREFNLNMCGGVVTCAVNPEFELMQLEQPVNNVSHETLTKLVDIYHAINAVLMPLGMNGEITTRAIEVYKLMAVLREFDNGEYLQNINVNDLLEKPTIKYFVLDHENHDLNIVKTENEALNAAKTLIDECFNGDEWDEDSVNGIYVGTITHRAELKYTGMVTNGYYEAVLSNFELGEKNEN